MRRGAHQLGSALSQRRTWLSEACVPRFPFLQWRDSTYLVGLGGGLNEVGPGRPSCPAVGEKAAETRAEGEAQGKAEGRHQVGAGLAAAPRACGGRAAGQPCRSGLQTVGAAGDHPLRVAGSARRGPEHRQPQRGGLGAARPPHYRELWESILTAPEPTLTVAPEKKFP